MPDPLSIMDRWKRWEIHTVGFSQISQPRLSGGHPERYWSRATAERRVDTANQMAANRNAMHTYAVYDRRNQWRSYP